MIHPTCGGLYTEHRLYIMDDFSLLYLLKQNSVKTIHSDCLVTGEQTALLLNFLFFLVEFLLQY